MENYNVLGKFEKLSSANIAKGLALPPSTDNEKPDLSLGCETFSDLEHSLSLPDHEESNDNKVKKSPVKKLKRTASVDKDSTIANQVAELQTSQTVVEPTQPADESISRRTRSAKKKSTETEQPPAAAAVIQKPSKRKTPKTASNNNCSSTASAMNLPTAARNTPGRNGKRRRTRSTMRNPNVSSDLSLPECILGMLAGAIPGFSPPIPGTRSIGFPDEFLQQNCAAVPICSPPISGARSFGASNEQNRSIMRTRRNFVAEHAARCNTVGYVDLVSSPMPRVEGVIDVTLDSDEETENKPSSSTNTNASTKKTSISSLDASFDEENPEMSIKIMWNGVLETFPLRKYQKFDDIFEKLAERSATGKENILLNLENKIITQNDTPSSINYKIFQFIYGRPMAETKMQGINAVGKKKRDPNVLKLKVQSDKWKRPLTLELHKTEKFKKLIIKCAEELKMPCEKVKLSFDGEAIQHDQTPTDLELEGGEVLEIHLEDNP